MGLEIKQLEPAATVHVVLAEQRLWQTADKESLVPEGHPDAAFLYCVPGQQLPVEEAIRYGLVKGAKKTKPTVEPDPDPDPDPDPQVDLDSMKLVELREHAAKVGVDAETLKALSKNGTSKKQVIEAINRKLAD